MDKSISRTSLHEWHQANSNNIIPFAGFLLPVYYSSIVKEHLSIRNSVGLFDVSHMGEFIISGLEAEKFVQLVTINDISKIKIGQAQYSAMCDQKGGIIDDVIIYKKKNDFMMVVNASNIGKNFKWLESVLIKNVKIKDLSSDIGLIAIQGPLSRRVLQRLVEEDISNLPFYHFMDGIQIVGHKVLLSRTGYTGELGYEIYALPSIINIIWERLMKIGKPEGIIPAGLGCRDTLRMEMNYPLYGIDINQAINPLEAGLDWITRLDKNNFIGKEAIQEAKIKINKKLFCFIMLDKAIPRSGSEVVYGQMPIGKVTSGTMSPSLKKGIGIGYIDKSYYQLGSKIMINLRGKLKEAKIVEAPFYKFGSARC